MDIYLGNKKIGEGQTVQARIHEEDEPGLQPMMQLIDRMEFKGSMKIDYIDEELLAELQQSQIPPEPNPIRAGLLAVMPHRVDFTPKVIPPDHQVRAVRSTAGFSDMIIEGPMMPVWEDRTQDPSRVHLNITAKVDDPEDPTRFSLFANWVIDGLPVGNWELGTWDRMEELQAWLNPP